MASRRPGRLKSAFGAGFLGLLAVGMTSFAPSRVGRGSAGPEPAGTIDSVVVRRMDLDTTLLAGGDLMPVKQTTVICEVEDLDRGPNGGGDAGTLILSIVPNGATVKKGDVLCVLDSSGYTERMRTEQIDVETARADYRQAELTLETAKVAPARVPGGDRPSANEGVRDSNRPAQFRLRASARLRRLGRPHARERVPLPRSCGERAAGAGAHRP